MTDRSRPGLSVDCDEIVELVTDYLEGSLPPDLRTEVEAHLALCAMCQTYLEQMRSTIDELGRVPIESLSAQAQDDLMAAFRTYHAVGEA